MVDKVTDPYQYIEGLEQNLEQCRESFDLWREQRRQDKDLIRKLASALERTTNNFRNSLEHKTIRDVTETLAEVEHTFLEYEKWEEDQSDSPSA
jgi:hypothetical protein